MTARPGDSGGFPRPEDLLSLAHYGHVGPAVPNAAGTGQWTAGDPFIDVQSWDYWTSDRNVANASQGWIVNMANGESVAFVGTGEQRYVWPVREQRRITERPRFTDNADGTVTDNLTGLIWLRDANCLGQLPWEEAVGIAGQLHHGDCGLMDQSRQGAWRLPNVRELGSLVDRRRINPAISNAAGTATWTQGDPFLDVQLWDYWTSTTATDNQDWAWIVNLSNGEQVRFVDKITTRWVWAVRGP